MRRSFLFRYDSFKAAKSDLTPLFDRIKPNREQDSKSKDTYSSATGAKSKVYNRKDAETIEKLVRKHLLFMPRHLSNSKYVSQKRSWVRSAASLLFAEAKKEKNYLVSQAALKIVIVETDLFPTVEVQWLRDSFASCASMKELQLMEGTMRQEVRALSLAASSSSGDTAEAAEGAIDAHTNRALLARENAITAVLAQHSFLQPHLPVLDQKDTADGVGAMGSGIQQLGDSDLEEVSMEQSSLASYNADGTAEGVPAGEEPPEVREARVAAAVAHRTPAAAGDSLLSPEQRALRAIQQLQRHRDSLTVSPNHSFARFFLKQQIVRDEGELQSLVQHLRGRPTSVGVRVHGSHPFAAAALALLSSRAPSFTRVSYLPSCCNAFELHCGPEVPFRQLQSDREFIRSLTKEGAVSFQGISSMLSVHFLGLKPGDRFLDLCAAPGNKTLLALDYMTNHTNSTNSVAAPLSGAVVSNEADEGRAQALSSRLGGFMNSSLVATICADGGRLGSSNSDPWDNGNSNRTHAAGVEGFFNKILVDAPCSGEGRLGKDPLAWRLWHPRRSLEFFSHQLALLRRAVQLLSPTNTTNNFNYSGGASNRIVYCTCTLNPLENEAVVAAILREGRGNLRLIPPPTLLPSPPFSSFADAAAAPPVLARGLRRWYVPTPSGGFYSSYADALHRGEEEQERMLSFRDGLLRQLFCPEQQLMEEGSDAASDKEARNLEADIAAQVERCCRRVLPHQANGLEGFFIAIIEKKSDAPTNLLPRASLSETRVLPSSFAQDSQKAMARAILQSTTPTLFHKTGHVQLSGVHSSNTAGGVNSSMSGAIQSLFDCISPSANGDRDHIGKKSNLFSIFLNRTQLVPIYSVHTGLSLVAADTLQFLRSIHEEPDADRLERHFYHSNNNFNNNNSNNSNKSIVNPRGQGFRDRRAQPFFFKPQKLMQMGVHVAHTNGQLTEAGAQLLNNFFRINCDANYQSSAAAVVPLSDQMKDMVPLAWIKLPLKYAQLLLSSQKLRLHEEFLYNPERSDPERMAVAAASNRLVSSTARDGQHRWVATLVSQLHALLPQTNRGAGGLNSSNANTSAVIQNAIVALEIPNNKKTGVYNDNNKLLTECSQFWSFPVSIQVKTRSNSPHNFSNNNNNNTNNTNGKPVIASVEINLRLSSTSRDRYIAMLGRLISLEKREYQLRVSDSTNGEITHSNNNANEILRARETLQENLTLNEENTVTLSSENRNAGNYYSSNVNVSNQNRSLFGRPPSERAFQTPAGGDASKDGSTSVREEGDSSEDSSIFEL